jgi:UPF0716 protein FxsA
MLFRLFVAIIILAGVEISILLEVYRVSANAWGRAAGLLVTFGSVALAGVLGIVLIRRQGLSTLRKVRACAERHESPALPLADGALVLIGGILLLIPGLLTDVIGLSMCIPGPRSLWRALLVRWVRGKIKSGTAVVRTYTAYAEGPSLESAPEQHVIDVTPRDQPVDGVSENH